MDALNGANLTQLVSKGILNAWWDCEKEALGRGSDEWDSRSKDKDSDKDRGKRVKTGPAEIFDKESGYHNRNRAEGVGEDMEEDTMHILIVVVRVAVVIVRVFMVRVIVFVIVVAVIMIMVMVMVVVVAMPVAAALFGLFMRVPMGMRVSVGMPVMDMSMIKRHNTNQVYNQAQGRNCQQLP